MTDAIEEHRARFEEHGVYALAGSIPWNTISPRDQDDLKAVIYQTAQDALMGWVAYRLVLGGHQLPSEGRTFGMNLMIDPLRVVVKFDQEAVDEDGCDAEVMFVVDDLEGLVDLIIGVTVSASEQAFRMAEAQINQQIPGHPTLPEGLELP